MKKAFPYFLFLYHLVFAWFAYDYVNQNNGDAVKYWFVGKNLSHANWLDFLGPGSEFIQFITFPFVKYLQLPGWAGCLLFSALSGIGFVRLWGLLKEIATGNRVLLWVSIAFLLLPNVHFWTSLIGKEAMLFLPIVLITEEIYKKRYFSVQILLSFLLIAWVRPHLAFVFLVAYGTAVFWKGEIALKTKSILAGLTLGCGAVLYFLLSQITHARDGLITKIVRLYEAHNLKLKGTSAYVPMEEYSFPYKLFTFYFRPLPLEKQNLHYTLIGFENLFLFILFIGILILVFRNFKSIRWGVFQVFAMVF